MLLTITIKPNSKKGPLVETNDDGSLVVYVREPAIDGRANDALVLLLSKHLNAPKTRIRIIRGASSRTKIVEIEE